MKAVLVFTKKEETQYYQALLNKDQTYEGVFFVGVKTTGVFCWSTCYERKPKKENCQFFETVQQAFLASFRSCRACKSLSHPEKVSNLFQKIVEAVEKNPENIGKKEILKLFP